MNDPAQILLFIIIIILTIFLVVLGIQVSLILKDLRVTLKKANKVLDNTDVITESIATPVSTLSQTIMGVKAGSAVTNFLRKLSSEERGKK